MRIKFAPLFAIVALLSGCGDSTDSGGSVEKGYSRPEASQSAPAIDYATIDPATTATLKGKVVFEGAVPPPEKLDMGGNPECKALHHQAIYEARVSVDNGALKDAFVYIKSGLEKYKFKIPADSVVIDQDKCRFIPRIVGVQTGQPIILRNSDPTLHNVHASPVKSSGWNIGLTSAGSQQTVSLRAPEIMVPLKCDLHSWMTAHIGAVAHPYFKVTGADGSFEFKGLPAGEYTINVWHEILGTQSQKIKLEQKETKEVVPFTFQPK